LKISFSDYCKESSREYLINEWHPAKNGTNTPQNTAKTSRKIIWWKCDHGHEWQTQAASRLYGTGCPYCYRIKQEQKRIEKASDIREQNHAENDIKK